MNDYRIVYSSDGSHLKDSQESDKNVEIIPESLTLCVRRETKSRGGKQVTVIYDLPNNQKYFKKLAKELKGHCGVGGSFKVDRIEIQGNQVDRVKSLLEKKGFKTKITGG